MQTPVSIDPASDVEVEPVENDRVQLLRVVPSTSMFSGWGPRMESSIHTILRSRN